MARPKQPKPQELDAAEDAFEHELASGETVPPRVDLRRKAKQRPRRAGDPDPVETAEAAMSRLSVSFDGWMRNELETLLDRWTLACDDGYSLESRAALFRAAHDIRGQAATLGYPVAGDTAASLCALLADGPDADRLPRALVDQHVQAIRAMVREDARDEHVVARALAERLAGVTRDYLAALARAA